MLICNNANTRAESENPQRCSRRSPRAGPTTREPALVAREGGSGAAPPAARTASAAARCPTYRHGHTAPRSHIQKLHSCGKLVPHSTQQRNGTAEWADTFSLALIYFGNNNSKNRRTDTSGKASHTATQPGPPAAPTTPPKDSPTVISLPLLPCKPS